MTEPISDIEETPETPENESKAPLSDNGEEVVALTPYDKVEREWGATFDKRQALIIAQAVVPISSKRPLTKGDVELVTEVAREWGVPFYGINIIPSKKGPSIYINSDGIKFKLHTDERRFKSSEGRIIHMPTENEPYIGAYGKVEMQNGAWADNESWKEWPITDPRDKDRDFTLGDLLMKMITKAKRRAGHDLIVPGMPMYDPYYKEAAEKGWDIVEAEYKEIEEPKPPKENPEVISELVDFCIKQYNLKYKDILEFLGEESLDDYDILDVWNKIKEHYGREEERREETEDSQ